jgi:uncharacterized protein
VIHLYMRLEWDEAKRSANITKHGFDFTDAATFFEGDIVEFEDLREDYGELRFRAYGVLNGVIIQVVYTPREETLRLISMRKATNYEAEQYLKAIRQ